MWFHARANGEVFTTKERIQPQDIHLWQTEDDHSAILFNGCNASLTLWSLEEVRKILVSDQLAKVLR